MFEKIKDALKDAQERLERIYSGSKIKAQQLTYDEFWKDFTQQYGNQLLAERAALLRLGLAEIGG